MVRKDLRVDSSNEVLENFTQNFMAKEGKSLCFPLTAEVIKHLRSEFSRYKAYNFRLIEMPRSETLAKAKGLRCSFSITFEFMIANDLLLNPHKNPEKAEEARKIKLRLENEEMERAYLNRITKHAYTPFENIVRKTLAEFCRGKVIELGITSFNFSPNIKLIKETTYSLEFKASLRVEATFKHLNAAAHTLANEGHLQNKGAEPAKTLIQTPPEYQSASSVKFSVSGNVPSEVLHKVDKKTEERLFKKAAEKLRGQDIEKIEVKFAPNIVNASGGTFYRSNVHAYAAGKAIKICEVRIRHKQ